MRFVPSLEFLYLRYFFSYVVFIFDYFLSYGTAATLACLYVILALILALSHYDVVYFELVFKSFVSVVSNSNFRFLFSCVKLLNGLVFLPFFLNLRTFFRSVLDLPMSLFFLRLQSLTVIRLMSQFTRYYRFSILLSLGS